MKIFIPIQTNSPLIGTPHHALVCGEELTRHGSVQETGGAE